VWLARLLNRCDGAYVAHEPVVEETWAHRDAIEDPRCAVDYLRRFRIKEICLRVREEAPRCRVYGEVNGTLRRHIVALREVLPAATLIHVVRDGREVVRSLCNRGTYSGGHPVYGDFVPKPVDRVSRNWPRVSEFQRACWIWQHENSYMRAHVPHLARFEDIVSSYEAFADRILRPLDLSLPRGVWEGARGEPENRSETYAFPGWSEWSRAQREQFMTICGEEMRAYGYDVVR